MLAGVGKVSAGQRLSGEALRRAAGSAVRQLAGLPTVTLAFPTADVADVAAVAEGAALGAYSFTEHRSSKDGLKDPVRNAVIFTDLAGDKELEPALKRAALLGKAVNATRSLVNQPPSHLYPESFADAAKELAKGLPVKVTVWDEKRLEKEGFGGIMGVGKGSARQPRLVKVEYAPAKATRKIALVGKGITFDTGGISIKPALGMGDMKSDMAGAAVVLNTVLALAGLGLPVKATAWLCIAENMPSGAASRPADVLTMFGGKTVEVLNTDAEGRLVMADGIVAASQEYPDAIIDVATLTGAQLIALGNRTAGVMGADSVTGPLKAAADRAGELVWPMPLPEELRPEPRLPGGGPRQHRRAPRRHDDRGGVPARIRGQGQGRPADPLGAHRHRRPLLQQRRRPTATPPSRAPAARSARWWPTSRTSWPRPDRHSYCTGRARGLCGGRMIRSATQPRDTRHKRSTKAAARWSMDKWFAKVNHGSHK